MSTRSRVEALEDEVKELENGVKELRSWLTEKIVEEKTVDLSWYISYPIGYVKPAKTVHNATVLGKVDAIIEHLGISIEVNETPAKIVVKPASTITKRKYIKSGKYSKKNRE